MVRAIGKGSIASILSVVLNVVRIILWIAMAVLGIWFVLVVLMAAMTDVFESSPRLQYLMEDHWLVELFRIATKVVIIGVMTYVVNRLLEILATLRFSSPFVPENADRFTKVAGALVLGEIAKLGLSAASQIFTAAMDIESTVEFETKLEVWFVVLIVLVIAAVFREGARMKEDQDLTI